MFATTSCHLFDFIDPACSVEMGRENIPRYSFYRNSQAVLANCRYFGHPQWAKNYFESCHRSAYFQERWRAVLGGGWDEKAVVDIGCGPGNLYASLGGTPKIAIGVDISLGALQMAREIGYAPLQADAHRLPLRSDFADVVALNATLHHCNDMAMVLAEAARLVRSGGLLVSDRDPQQSAWHFRGLGRAFWDLRLPLYRLLGRGGHATREEQQCALAAEIHHRPGKGVTRDLFYDVLEPLGFEVAVYPHNQTLGTEVLQGNWGRSLAKYRWGQRLSGIDPDAPEAALSLMCVARRK